MNVRTVPMTLSLAVVAVAQTTWVRHNVDGRPPALGPAIAYDEAMQRMLLFGGGSRTSTVFDETWTWDGRIWRELQPATKPPSRSAAALVHDRDRGRVLLFGGVGDGAIWLEDTWEWDGSDWHELQPAHTPGPSINHSMFFNPATGRIILCRPGKLDLWEWDGADWRPLSVSNAPPARGSHGVAFDERRQRLVVYGADNFGPGDPRATETWEFDGLTWRVLRVSPNPGRRRGLSMVYDRRRGVVVLTGGIDGATFFKDVWEWDGVNWVNRTPQVQFPAFTGSPTVYDSVSGKVLLLYNGPSGNEVWDYVPVHPATYMPFGTGCFGVSGAGPVITAAPDSRPWLGEIFTVQGVLPGALGGWLLTGRSRTQAGVFRLPFDLTPLGMPGCTLLTSSDVVTPFVLRAGRLVVDFVIPNDPALAGVQVFQQALAPDPGANAIGAVLSFGAALAIGSK